MRIWYQDDKNANRNVSVLINNNIPDGVWFYSSDRHDDPVPGVQTPKTTKLVAGYLNKPKTETWWGVTLVCSYDTLWQLKEYYESCNIYIDEGTQ